MCAAKKKLSVENMENLSLYYNKPFGVTLERLKQVKRLDYAENENKSQISSRTIKSVS